MKNKKLMSILLVGAILGSTLGAATVSAADNTSVSLWTWSPITRTAEKMIAALEYPLLRWAYLFGIWFSALLGLILFFIPMVKAFQSKNKMIIIVLLILILDVNSYNGITTQSDDMLLYCVAVFLLLNLSYILRGNKNEDMHINTKSIYPWWNSKGCNNNFK